EHAFQCGPNRRMIATEREHAKAAQQVEIAVVRAVVEVLATSLAKAYIISDRLEDTDHLLVEAMLVQAEAVRLVGFKKRGDIGIYNRTHSDDRSPAQPVFCHPSPRATGSNAAYLP